LTSVYREVDKKRVKIAVKVADIFGNDTMTIADVSLKRGRRAGSGPRRIRACMMMMMVEE
jgi:hypothetical protein